MLTCSKCGVNTPKTEKLPEYRYELMGLSVILLNAAEQTECAACGHVVVNVPDLNNLAAAMAVSRVQLPEKLTGSDIRFLRKAVGETAKVFGDRIGAAVETISRWEKGAALIPEEREKMLRLNVAIALEDSAPAVDVDFEAIMKMKIKSVRDLKNDQAMVFERVKLKVNRDKKCIQWDSAPALVAVG